LLLERHADVVNRYLMNRHSAGDGLDPEDLLAEVFAIAWRRLESIPPDAEAPWLIGVARNRVLNMRTKRNRRLRISRGSRPGPTFAPAAEDEVIAESALRGAIEKLSETDREVLRLSAWEGFSPAEIGTSLGCSENAVRIRLSRAKAQLLKQLISENHETHKVSAKDTE
jgi:RNA polymerase sigma-70 factor (ECF subfamily)